MKLEIFIIRHHKLEISRLLNGTAMFAMFEVFKCFKYLHI